MARLQEEASDSDNNGGDMPDTTKTSARRTRAMRHRNRRERSPDQGSDTGSDIDGELLNDDSGSEADGGCADDHDTHVEHGRDVTTATDSVAYVKSRRTRSVRNRFDVTTLPPAHQDELEKKKAQHPGEFVDSFGVGRRFRSADLVVAALNAHAASTHTSYQVRNSVTVVRGNSTLKKEQEGVANGTRKQSKKCDEAPPEGEWPHELGVTLVYARCSKGVPRRSRAKSGDDTEERVPKESQFTGCKARITFKAVYDPITGSCSLVSEDEVSHSLCTMKQT